MVKTNRVSSLLAAAAFHNDASQKEADRIKTIVHLIETSSGYVPPRGFEIDLEGLLVQDNLNLTCQFGNPGDTSGYRSNTKVRIVSMKDDILGNGKKNYLVTDDQGFYGIATPCFHLGDVEGVLYCTMARRIGDEAFNVRNEEHAKQVFGF